MATIIPLHRAPPPLPLEHVKKPAAGQHELRMVIADPGPGLALSMPFTFALVVATVSWIAQTGW
jgi:hypothetical protein